MNGLAIVIFLSQLGMFKETNIVDGEKVSTFIGGAQLWIMLALVAGTMLIMFIIPRITKKIPAALTAIVVIADVVIL